MQYSSACRWEEIEKIEAVLKNCFPNSYVASYRNNKTEQELEIYVAASKAEPKSRVFSANGIRAEIEKEIIEAIKKQLGL